VDGTGKALGVAASGGALKLLWRHKAAAALLLAAPLTAPLALARSHTAELRTAAPGQPSRGAQAQAAADPSPSPPSSVSPAGHVLAVTHRDHGKGRHRREAAPVAVLTPPPPAPSPSASPSPVPSPPPSPVPGTLEVQQQSLQVGPGGSALLDLSAQGGDVTWTAQVPGGIALSVDGVPVTGGVIAAGGAVQVQVSVDPSVMVQPGSAVVVVSGQQVQVTWGR
jgi:hypothetical protein